MLRRSIDLATALGVHPPLEATDGRFSPMRPNEPSVGMTHRIVSRVELPALVVGSSGEGHGASTFVSLMIW